MIALRLTICRQPEEGVTILYVGFIKGRDIAVLTATRDDLVTSIEGEKLALGRRKEIPFLNFEMVTVSLNEDCSCPDGLMPLSFDGEEKEGVVVDV